MVILAPTSLSIIGPANGEAGTEYGYIFNADDPEDDNLYFYIGWCDGTNNGWIGPYNSGQEVIASHVWNEQGEYDIKVKAKDENYSESQWSDPLTVTIPKSKAINPIFFQFLEQIMQRFSPITRLLRLPVFEKLTNLR